MAGEDAPEGPCLPDGILEEFYQKQKGRPCPRVELHPDNDEAFRLASAMLSSTTRTVVPVYAMLLLDGMPGGWALEVTERAVAAAQSQAVADAMRPPAPLPSAPKPRRR